VQGYYDRDNDFYTRWDDISREADGLRRYLDEWVYGLPDRGAYIEKMRPDYDRLRARSVLCEPVNYGY
jgi:glutaconate CoA-transferase subunit A